MKEDELKGLWEALRCAHCGAPDQPGSGVLASNGTGGLTPLCDDCWEKMRRTYAGDDRDDAPGGKRRTAEPSPRTRCPPDEKTAETDQRRQLDLPEEVAGASGVRGPGPAASSEAGGRRGVATTIIPRSAVPGQPVPPEHLSVSSKGWWRAIVAEYALEPWHLRTLQAAAEAWDRGQQARLLIESEGIVSRGARGQLQPHPAVSVERDSRTAFLRALRELNLDADQGPQ